MRLLLSAIVMLMLMAADAVAQPTPPTQCVSNALGTGTGDAIVVPLLPCGLATNILLLTLPGINVTTAPTLQMQGFSPLPIVNANGATLSAGSLPGAGAVVMLTSTGTKWLLLNNNVAGNPITGFVQNIAAMVALGPASPFYSTLQVLGYNSVGDLGGGLFNWSAASVATPDSCTVFMATGVATGRWLRVMPPDNSIAVEQCGAYNNGSNPTATTLAVQAAVNYVAGSGIPTSTIYMRGSVYAINAPIVKALSFYCPNIVGGGSGTNINFTGSPSSEAPVFEFIGGSGAQCGGGVKGLTINGNANTVGCEFLSQSGAYCNITLGTGEMAVLWCACSSFGFAEDDTASILIPVTAGVVGSIGEFRVSGGGSGSFRGSGLNDDSIVSVNGHLSKPLILVGSSAFWYAGHFGGVFTFNGGGTIGTSILISNHANYQAARITSGHIRVEGDASDPIEFADPAQQQIFYEGTYEMNGPDITTGFVTANVIFTKTFAINGSGVVDNHNADSLATAQTFAGNAGVNLGSSNLSAQNFSTYNITISSANYVWHGIVQVTANNATTSSCGATLTSSLLESDPSSYGAPTISCANAVPLLTNASWTSASFTALYSVHVY